MPAHVDPTVSQHERLHVVDGDEVRRGVGRRPPRLVSRLRQQVGSGERAEGAGAVADGVLLGGGHLGEGAAVALDGHDDRVVAEAAVAPRARRRSRPSTVPRTTTSRPSGHTAAAAQT